MPLLSQHHANDQGVMDLGLFNWAALSVSLWAAPLLQVLTPSVQSNGRHTPGKHPSRSFSLSHDPHVRMWHRTEPSRVSTGCFFYFSEHGRRADNIAPVWEPHTKCPDKTMASSKIYKHAQKKKNHEIKDNKQQRETHTQNLLVFMSH